MRRLTLIFICIVLLLINCAIPEDESFTIQKQDYVGNGLRFDGYYFTSDNLVEFYVFYRNGVLLKGVGETNQKIEEEFSNGAFYAWAKGDKGAWGVFNVLNERMVFECLYSSNSGQYLVYRYDIEILNDSTFRIIESCRRDGSGIKSDNRIFLFKKFSPKPDSVTKFIQ